MSSYTNLLYHIVFSTKSREPLISESIRPRLYDYFGAAVRDQGGLLHAIGAYPIICICSCDRVRT